MLDSNSAIVPRKGVPVGAPDSCKVLPCGAGSHGYEEWLELAPTGPNPVGGWPGLFVNRFSKISLMAWSLNGDSLQRLPNEIDPTQVAATLKHLLLGRGMRRFINGAFSLPEESALDPGCC